MNNPWIKVCEEDYFYAMETRLFCSDFVPFSLKVSHPGPG